MSEAQENKVKSLKLEQKHFWGQKRNRRHFITYIIRELDVGKEGADITNGEKKKSSELQNLDLNSREVGSKKSKTD